MAVAALTVIEREAKSPERAALVVAERQIDDLGGLFATIRSRLQRVAIWVFEADIAIEVQRGQGVAPVESADSTQREPAPRSIGTTAPTPSAPDPSAPETGTAENDVVPESGGSHHDATVNTPPPCGRALSCGRVGRDRTFRGRACWRRPCCCRQTTSGAARHCGCSWKRRCTGQRGNQIVMKRGM